MSQNTEPGAVVDEKTALLAGGIASVVAVIIAVVSIGQVLSVIGSFIWLGIGLYVAGLFVQYWTAQSYKDGLTVKELTLALLWPVDTFKKIREGVNRQNLRNAFTGTHLPSDQDDTNTLVNEKIALWGGVALTVVVGLPLLGFGINSVLGLVGDVIWLLIAIYVVGFVVNFWTSKSYLNGLTKSEIVLNALWPVDVIKKIRAGAAANA